MRLVKHHGLGNDFLIALETDNRDAAEGTLVPDSDFARRICDRRTGIGADGLIYGLGSIEAGLEMVLINSDGSAAEISGNGIRCLVHAALRAEGHADRDVPEQQTIKVDTAGGLRSVEVLGGHLDSEMSLQVDMGPAMPGPELSPATIAYDAANVSTVDIGNPHLVMQVESPDDISLDVDGPVLEAGYPSGMNVHFVAPRPDGGLELRVWERGAGITEACGSGAAAAVVAAQSWGIVSTPVEVHMPGGVAVVTLGPSSVILAGPSVFVGEVTTP